MITPDLKKEIEKNLGITMNMVAPLSAANNAYIYRVTTSKGENFVIKASARGLEVEAFMLKYLKTTANLPVPEIYYSNDHVIVMQFMSPDWHLDDATQINAARHIAALHSIRADRYGFERDTSLSSLRQPNPYEDNWIVFFRDHRLMYMAREALREDKIDIKLMKKIEKLASRLDTLIGTPNPPSLIHGDIWGGNILTTRGRILAFLDPAIYYADPEIELAFTTLFDTFNHAFFNQYQSVHPIREGFFEERKDIYNIYPLLVHARLFGPSYARKVQKIVERFTG